jgi:hypothetical protein
MVIHSHAKRVIAYSHMLAGSKVKWLSRVQWHAKGKEKYTYQWPADQRFFCYAKD